MCPVEKLFGMWMAGLCQFYWRTCQLICFLSWSQSPFNIVIQQSREFQRRLHSASSHELSVPCTWVSTYATELFQSSLYGSGTVFCSISHLCRYLLSFAVTWRHTSLNSVTHNYCCRAREVPLSFMDTLIAFTYLLFVHLLVNGYYWTRVLFGI